MSTDKAHIVDLVFVSVLPTLYTAPSTTQRASVCVCLVWETRIKTPKKPEDQTSSIENAVHGVAMTYDISSRFKILTSPSIYIHIYIHIYRYR